MLTLAALGLLPDRSHAALLTITSTSGFVSVGEQFTIDYVVSDLSGDAGNSLSAFDLDVQFDAGLFAFSGGSYFDLDGASNRLDLLEPASFGFIGSIAPAAAGVIDAFGISGNSAATLDALQPDSFRFLSLSFIALAGGTGTFSIDLFDPALLFLDSTVFDLPVFFDNASVQVTVGAIPVPEPGSLLLLLGALTAAAVRGRRGKPGP